MQLRDYQKQAIESCLLHLQQKETNPIISATGGAGKSIIIAKIAEILDERCLILADRKELLSQNHSKFHSDCDVGIVSAGLNKWEFDKKIVIGGIQTIYNKAEQLGRRDYIIIDECFPNYHKVDGKFISDYQIGNLIKSYNHKTQEVEKKKIIAISKKPINDYMSRLTLSNGLIIDCSHNHPFYEQTKGYINASEAKIGDIFWMLPSVSDFYCKTYKKPLRNIKSFRSYFLLKKMLLCLSRHIIKYKIKRPKSQVKVARGKTKNDCDIQKNWSQTTYKRGERAADTRAAKKITRIIRKWLEVRVYNQHQWWKKIWLPNSLQNRYCEPSFKNCSRGGWWQPLFFKTQTTRFKERKLFKRIRVDSVEIFEPRSDERYRRMQGDNFIYNLQVEDNSNYFCESVLVHNCDLVSNTPNDDSMYWQLIRQYPNAKIIGLTGTPWRTGEGKLTWGEICYNITYKDLLEKGYLSPITNKIMFNPDLSKVPKLGGDYTERGLKEQFLDKANLGDWVEQLEEFKHQRKKWLIRFPSVEYAEKFAFALSGIRVRCSALTGNTLNIDRDKIIKDYRNSEIQALSTVGIASRGLDIPDIDLLIDFKSTLSLKDWLQFVWRGVRLAEEKKDCWLLDFCGNLKEHGSIHNQDWLLQDGEIKIKKKYVEKICPACETFIPAFAKTCPHCHHDFIQEQIKKKASLSADTESDINSEWEAKPKYNWYHVSDVIYEPEYISKKGKKNLRVTYKLGQNFKQYQYLWGGDKTTFLVMRGWKGGEVDWDKLRKPVKIALGKQKNNPSFNEIKEFKWE